MNQTDYTAALFKIKGARPPHRGVSLSMAAWPWREGETDFGLERPNSAMHSIQFGLIAPEAWVPHPEAGLALIVSLSAGRDFTFIPPGLLHTSKIDTSIPFIGIRLVPIQDFILIFRYGFAPASRSLTSTSG
jgi:hypothetical protein